MKNQYGIDMLNGPVFRNLLLFSIPIMLTGVLQLLFNAVDIIVVGRFAGSDCLAAVGATTSLINVFTNVFIGISLGVNVMTARYFAAEKKEDIFHTVHTAILTALISGIGLAILGFVLSDQALVIMDTPDEIIGLSGLYLHIYFLGMPFFMLYNFGSAILRAVGDSKRPLYYLIAAGFMNVFLNLILVICFHLGVAGVAIATVFSQFVSSVLVMRCLMTINGPMRVDLRKLHISLRHLREILIVGLPTGLQSMIINLSNAMLQSSVNSFGAIAMAGYTASNNMLGFMYMTVNAVTQGCMSFTSQNLGAGKKNRMDSVLCSAILINLIFPILIGTIFFLAGPYLLHIYAREDEVISVGMEILTVTTLPYFFCGIMDVLPGYMRGLGYAAVPMCLSVVGTVLTRIIWIYGFFPHKRTITYLFYCYPGSWIVTILLQAFCLYLVRKKVMKSLD